MATIKDVAAVDLLLKAVDGVMVPKRTILPVTYIERETTVC